MRIDPNTGAMTLGVMAFGPSREPISAMMALMTTIGSTIAGSAGTAAAVGAPLTLASAAPVASGITASGISATLGALGTGVSALGAIAQGNAAEAEGNYLARQQEMKANEERSIGQQKMLRKRAEAERLQSTLIARAAASGGDTTDAGLVRLGGDIAEEGEFQALNEFVRGENAARGYLDMAKASRAKGAAAQRMAPLKAGMTILEGGSSLFGKYAKGFG